MAAHELPARAIDAEDVRRSWPQMLTAVSRKGERIVVEEDGVAVAAIVSIQDLARLARAADVIVVPVIPSPLSQRALDEVMAFLDRKKLGRGAVLPVFNMVDHRRRLHEAALAAMPNWPVIPMASAFEQMSVSHRPIGDAARRSPGAAAVAELWTAIERRLNGGRKS